LALPIEAILLLIASICVAFVVVVVVVVVVDDDDDDDDNGKKRDVLNRMEAHLRGIVCVRAYYSVRGCLGNSSTRDSLH
jgi:hypothetical protein